MTRDMRQVQHLIENERTGPDLADSYASNIRALPNWQYDLITRMVNRFDRYSEDDQVAVLDYVADATRITDMELAEEIFGVSGFEHGYERIMSMPFDTPPEIS